MPASHGSAIFFGGRYFHGLRTGCMFYASLSRLGRTGFLRDYSREAPSRTDPCTQTLTLRRTSRNEKAVLPGTTSSGCTVAISVSPRCLYGRNLFSQQICRADHLRFALFIYTKHTIKIEKSQSKEKSVSCCQVQQRRFFFLCVARLRASS